jgi:excisionase family DNA binding protein
MIENKQNQTMTTREHMHEGAMKYSRDYLTTREAADMLGVSLGTIQKMAEYGELVAWKTSGGHRRIKSDSVEKYLRMNCNIASYASRRQVSVLMVGSSHDTRSFYLNEVSGWNLPLRLHFVDDEFHLLMRVLQLSPDIVLFDSESQQCPCLEMVKSLKRHELTNHMDVIVLKDKQADSTASLGEVPNGVVVWTKPLSFELLRGYVSAKITSKLNDAR